MPDVNILVYAHRADEKTHAAHRRWLEDVMNGPQPFALSVLAAVGFIRIVTNSRIYATPTPPQVAIAAIEKIREQPQCRVVVPGPDHLERVLELCRLVSATGDFALFSNTMGNNNTASGQDALELNTTGFFNTASGAGALISNTTGSSNIGIGVDAGENIVAGSNNIEIWATPTISPLSDESNTIRIGLQSTQTATFVAGIFGRMVNSSGVPVLVDNTGKLGVTMSSARYKRDIHDMGAASSGLMKLRPVVFRYRSEPNGQQQYGLIAEEVARVYPELVDYDNDGKPLMVRYLELNAMLLNEVQKQARETWELAQRLETKDRQLAAQQHEIDALKQQNVSINALSERLAALEQQARMAKAERVQSLASK